MGNKRYCSPGTLFLWIVIFIFYVGNEWSWGLHRLPKGVGEDSVGSTWVDFFRSKWHTKNIFVNWHLRFRRDMWVLKLYRHVFDICHMDPICISHKGFIPILPVISWRTDFILVDWEANLFHSPLFLLFLLVDSCKVDKYRNRHGMLFLPLTRSRHWKIPCSWTLKNVNCLQALPLIELTWDSYIAVELLFELLDCLRIWYCCSISFLTECCEFINFIHVISQVLMLEHWQKGFYFWSIIGLDEVKLVEVWALKIRFCHMIIVLILWSQHTNVCSHQVFVLIDWIRRYSRVKKEIILIINLTYHLLLY